MESPAVGVVCLSAPVMPDRPVLSVFPARTLLPAHQRKVVILLGAHRKRAWVAMFGDVLRAALRPPTLVLAWLSVAGHVPRGLCGWKSDCSSARGLGQCVPTSELSAQPGPTAWSEFQSGGERGQGKQRRF